MSENETDSAQEVVSQKAEQLIAAQRAAMRAALDNVDLTPEQTTDDIAPTSAASDYLADVPPHHGGH